MDGPSWGWGIWAQVVTLAPGGMPGLGSGATPTPGGSASLPTLALRRWGDGLTLSPPSVTAGRVPEGAWAFLAGLGALLAVAMVAQGPRRALGQLVDVRGHAALWEAASARALRATRLLIVAVGASVVSWTVAQGLRYSAPAGREDLALLLQDRRAVDVAWAQGALAALTPLRDVVGLASMIPMLAGVAFVLFQFSTFRWSAVRPDPAIRGRVNRWSTLGWMAAAAYAIYRFISFVGGLSEMGPARPLRAYLFGPVEAALVPALMLLADGVVAAWALVELRRAGGGGDDDRLDVTGIVLAIPAAVVGCALAFPARYIAAGVVLVSDFLPASLVSDPRVGPWLRWELGPGLAAWQALGMLFAAWWGAAAWSGGGIRATARGYGRTLASDGGRVVAVLLAAGLSAGGLATAAYALILALPGSPWVLLAADSYAHYATLPVGLMTLAGLVELGGRSAVLPPKPPKPEEDWAA